MLRQANQTRKNMTENQEKQIMTMLTRCVNGIQDLRTDVTELKTDVTELKTDVAELRLGQARMEKDIKIINKSLSTLAENSLESRSRIEILEEKIEHIN